MRKIAFLFVSLLIAGFAMGQASNYKYGVNGYNYRPAQKLEIPTVSNAAKDVIWSDDFEDGSIADWTLYDEDGDGQNWSAVAVDGANVMTSASWVSGLGAVTPENWAVTPAIDLTSATGAVFIDFQTWAQDQGWTSEHYKVMVSTTTNAVAAFTDNIYEETIPGQGVFDRTVSLSDYTGETIYIAFVHYDCTDMFRINIDNVSVYTSNEVNLAITAATAPTNEAACQLTNAENVTMTIYNSGGVDATDFEVSYTIEGGDSPVTFSETYSEVLASGTSVDYTFTQTADFSNLGYYTITYEVAIDADVNLANNVLTKEIRSTDATILVKAYSDAAGDQTWTITNIAGEVVGSFNDYQWNVNKDVQVCVLDNDCYTFQFSGFDATGWIEILYNGEVVAGGQTAGNTVGGVTWYGIGGGCAAIDAKLDKITTPDYAAPGDVEIMGRVMNVGQEAITSYDVTYTIDSGDESAIYSVTGLNIATGGTHDFTHDVPFNFPEEGTFQISVTVSNINGDTDSNLENNTLTKNVLITTQQMQRTVVLEQFTTESCPNCPPVLTILEGHLANNPNFVMMGHHSGYYTDWLTIPAHTAHLEFFNAGGSTYAPAGMVDRNYNGEDNDADGTPDPGPVFWNGGTNGTSYIDARTAEPAFVTVDVNGENNAGDVTVRVSGEFIMGFDQDLGVSLWVTEDHIAADAQAGATNWVHRFTSRMVVSERLGDAIVTSTDGGMMFTKDYTFTLDASWNVDELYLVAFVNNMSNDINNREIHNAKQVKLTDLVALGEEFAVDFTITDGTNPIEGAVITVYGAEITTDATGAALITLPDGDYNYTVTKDGFENYIGTATVAGEPVDVAVSMTPMGIGVAKAHLSVYPNPSNGAFTINVDGTYDVQVLNNLGQVVYSEKVESSKVINLSDLASGVYILTVKNNNKFATQNIVIK